MKNCNFVVYSNDETKLRRLRLLYKDFTTWDDIREGNPNNEFKNSVWIRGKGWTSIKAKYQYQLAFKMTIEDREKMTKDCGLINIGVNHKHDWFFDDEEY